MRNFIAVYLMYRRCHSPLYALKSAWGITVRGLPF